MLQHAPFSEPLSTETPFSSRCSSPNREQLSLGTKVPVVGRQAGLALPAPDVIIRRTLAFPEKTGNGQNSQHHKLAPPRVANLATLELSEQGAQVWTQVKV